MEQGLQCRNRTSSGSSATELCHKISLMHCKKYPSFMCEIPYVCTCLFLAYLLSKFMINYCRVSTVNTVPISETARSRRTPIDKEHVGVCMPEAGRVSCHGVKYLSAGWSILLKAYPVAQQRLFSLIKKCRQS